MASKDLDIEGMVVKKTRLGESDLIAVLLTREGSQISIVAKGARKPKSAFSSYFELFNVLAVMCAAGRGLPIAREVRLLEAPFARACDPARMYASQCVAELAYKLSQPDLCIMRFFDLTRTALNSLASCKAQAIATNVAAYFVKAAAMSGVAPMFRACAVCGAPSGDVLYELSRIGLNAAPGEGEKTPALLPSAKKTVAFSVEAGGVVCRVCSGGADFSFVDAEVAALAEFLLRSTFADINASNVSKDAVCALEVCDLVEEFLKCHLGVRLRALKSLSMYL